MPDLVRYIVVSAGLGALIGLIRQWGEQTGKTSGDLAGVRTYTLWAVLGCLGAFASEAHTPHAFIAVLLLVAAHLVAQAAREGDGATPGSTSLAGAMLTLFIGALVFWEETKSAILVAAATMVLLGLKQPIHKWTREITPRDIRATIQFAAIAGVILPLVPDRDMGPFDGFNPFSTWLMVVLISGVGFAGYVAVRLVGARSGIPLSGLLGGIASSTATTLAFSRRSRDEHATAEHYALAVVAACTVMLPRVMVVTGVVNAEFARTLILPFALMAVPGIVYAGWVWLRRRPPRHSGEQLELGNPLNLSAAIKFAALYTAIAFAVKVIRAQGWTEGLLPLSFVSGLTDMDAISLSLARDHGDPTTASDLTTRAVVLAAVSNTLLKAGLAIALGSRGLKVRVALVLGATAVIGVAWMLLGAHLSLFGETRAQ